jgi:replication factor C subunit 2/4
MHGPPGTGKTSTILALAKELFGPEFYRSRILELNASDDRGIGVVREKIKKFAQKKIAKASDSAYPCPPIQIIILDEADSMTVDAQAALRRTIEVYSAQTRFCIICNYVSKIIEPLASRWVKFRFTPISNEAQIKRLAYIWEKENITYEDTALNALVDVTEGDLRKSIMMLQSAGRSCEGNSLTGQDIYEVSGRVPKEVIDEIWTSVIDRNWDENRATEIAEDIIYEGFDVMQLLTQLVELVINEPTRVVTDLQKAKIAEVCASTEAKMIKGGSEELNMLYLFMNISKIMKK